MPGCGQYPQPRSMPARFRMGFSIHFLCSFCSFPLYIAMRSGCPASGDIRCILLGVRMTHTRVTEIDNNALPRLDSARSRGQDSLAGSLPAASAAVSLSQRIQGATHHHELLGLFDAVLRSRDGYALEHFARRAGTLYATTEFSSYSFCSTLLRLGETPVFSSFQMQGWLCQMTSMLLRDAKPPFTTWRDIRPVALLIPEHTRLRSAQTESLQAAALNHLYWGRLMRMPAEDQSDLLVTFGLPADSNPTKP